jgi:predicted MPP superfamily phosphohydrolase
MTSRLRKTISALIAIIILTVLIDAIIVEPTWYRIKELSLSKRPSVKVVHITDLHFKGETKYLQSVISSIKAVNPDFVCFTGDIVEETRFLSPALVAFKQLGCPVYGVPGNHDKQVTFPEISKTFQDTGGAWLVSGAAFDAKSNVALYGSESGLLSSIAPVDAHKRILLVHYPEDAIKAMSESFSIILAGHSHGGQVRLPFYGALVLPYGVGSYQKGMYKTSNGPLYVNPGLGTYQYRVRFLCRPEITVIYL